MEITEVRIKLMEDSDDRLQGFCSITFDDCFVVRDLKIIEGTNGPFVAMPSRKLTSHCPQCGCKNHLRAAFCCQCGLRMKDDRAIRDQEGRSKLYADIAHPINSQCREMIQECVIKSYQEERERAKQPGYVSRYDDDFFDEEGPRRSATDDVEKSPPTPDAERKQQIDPAEAEKKGPHKPPSTESAPRKDTGQDDEFGAGIFGEGNS